MITEAQAADVTNYLMASQALTAVEGMSAVWADYLNAEIPNIHSADLLPAARDCLKTWAKEGRSWRVDLPRYAQAVQRVRKRRRDQFKQTHADPLAVGVDASDYPAWIAAYRQAASLPGATYDQVLSVAYQAIGRSAPTPAINEKHEPPTPSLKGI